MNTKKGAGEAEKGAQRVREPIIQINQTAAKLMKENISYNEGVRQFLASKDINLATLSRQQQEEILNHQGIRNNKELQTITKQLFAGVDCNIQHYDYEEEEELDYNGEEDYMEQEESEEEEVYEDLSSNEHEYPFEGLTNSERIENSKTSLIELLNLLNTREITHQQSADDNQKELSNFHA